MGEEREGEGRRKGEERKVKEQEDGGRRKRNEGMVMIHERRRWCKLFAYFLFFFVYLEFF